MPELWESISTENLISSHLAACCIALISTNLILELDALDIDRESTLDLIRLDISRTFPHLCIFQKVIGLFQHTFVYSFNCTI